MKLSTVLAMTGLASVLIASHAQAQLTGFVANPTTNSTDFSTFVTGMSGTINTDVNFDAHPLGTLQPNFYLGSDGVTLTGTSGMNQVTFGNGPGQGNTFSPPLSSGEGLHPASNYLYSSSPGVGGGTSLTISFTSPVSAVGLFTIDYFGPANTDNPLVITGYSGPNGTGTDLGSFTSVGYNFQMNNLYFMGLATTNGSNSIGSFIFSRPTDDTGDDLGLDNIEFARTSSISVPEPGAYALLGSLGLTGAAFLRRRRAR
jgi:hypothetical protein